MLCCGYVFVKRVLRLKLIFFFFFLSLRKVVLIVVSQEEERKRREEEGRRWKAKHQEQVQRAREEAERKEREKYESEVSVCVYDVNVLVWCVCEKVSGANQAVRKEREIEKGESLLGLDLKFVFHFRKRNEFPIS